MTLRGRLTTAFLVVVLGPVILGTCFAGTTLAANGRHRAADRLDLAAAVVRTSIAALCRQLRSTSGALALIEDASGRAGAAGQVVRQGLAEAVLIADADGRPVLLTPQAPPLPWTDCTGSTPGPAEPVRAIAARIELRDATGTVTGAVWAAERLDDDFVARLAAATGSGVTLLPPGPEAGADLPSSEPAGVRDRVLAAAERLTGNAVGEAGEDRYVRRIGPSPGQPLPLVLSVTRPPPRSLYALLGAAALGAGILAALAAWRLARSTTRPLDELAWAADRAAEGDLAARAPVRASDEVGRLASTFNRMTRETQQYAQALTCSRDQLRGHLALLGDTLASTHDLHRILRVILRSAVVATGARSGLVLLLDPATGTTLVGHCAEEVDDCRPGQPIPGQPASGPVATAARLARPTQEVRITVGNGLLGTVAATGEARRGRLDRDGPVLDPAEPHCRTYMAVPFVAPEPAPDGGLPTRSAPTGETGGSVLGVLALYDRLGFEEFDDSDLHTLRTFASHAAVAVENVRVHEEAQRLSLTDPLTGLWNYRYLKESMRREVERASRFNRMLSVLALDLDRFKEVNDTYGHAAGDAVLAEFARRIRTEVREVDLAFRQGGEEFVVLLPETDARGAAVVAERLGAAVRERPIMLQPRPGGGLVTAPTPVPVTVSIGVAVYPDHASTGQQVLDAADEALYAAKAAGRDTYRLAVPRRSGGRPEGVTGGASTGPHPPRQSRGR